MTETQPIPISFAQDAANKFGYDQIIIVGRVVGDKGIEHVTTYGKGGGHADAAAMTGDFLKRHVMRWLDQEAPRAISSIIRDICELPDRTSSEDQPDMMLVNEEELTIILQRRLMGKQ